MIALPIVYGPHPVFKKIAEPVESVNDEIRNLAEQMLATMYREGAIGLGANMVGILKRIIVVDLQEDGVYKPYIFINPEITYYSEELQTFTERSLSFPGIKAEITRPKSIKLKYLDKSGENQELEASGFFATVIQHELDYLNGKVFLDYLSKFKRDTLLKKMEKYINRHP
jgi:peptide deformylase